MTLVNDDRATGARPQDTTAMAVALAAAFQHDPVSRWFSPDDDRRGAMLPSFFAVFVEAYMAWGETYTDPGLAGAALWARPGSDPLGTDPGYGERLAEIAGVDAPRLFDVVERLEASAPTEAHHHLQILGVHPARQGAGLGGALMRPVLDRCDRDGVPAYLEATSDRNRALYERHRFRTVGTVPLPDGPTLWRMWRDPAG